MFSRVHAHCLSSVNFCFIPKMDAVIPILREQQKIRDAEFARKESQQSFEHNSREKELQSLRDKTRRYTETIAKNMNFTTAHRHAISKVIHESKQCSGLPISNNFHKKTIGFINDALGFLNNAKNVYETQAAEDSSDPYKLSANVQCCTQSTSDVFKGTQASVIKVETLMQNLNVIIDPYHEDEPSLERSIFDE